MRIKDVDRVKDSGMYKCEVGDANSRNNDKMTITVLGENESVVEITEPTNRYVVEISSRNREVKFSARVTGHPKPKSKWFDNRGNEIPYSSVSDKKSKHEIQIMDYSTILIIRNPDLSDFGNYTVKATNGVIEKEKQFKLIVKGELNDFYLHFDQSVFIGFLFVCSSADGCRQGHLHPRGGRGQSDMRMCRISGINDQMDVRALSGRWSVRQQPNDRIFGTSTLKGFQTIAFDSAWFSHPLDFFF